MVSVKLRGRLPELCGEDRLELEAARVSDVLRYLKGAFPAEAYREARRMLITVNGRSVLLLQVYKTPLSDGDTVSFLPICGGG